MFLCFLNVSALRPHTAATVPSPQRWTVLPDHEPRASLWLLVKHLVIARREVAYSGPLCPVLELRECATENEAGHYKTN